MKFLLLTLLLAPLCAAAQSDSAIYRTTDEQGNVVFTDAPAANSESERVTVSPINTAPPPDMPEPAAGEEEPVAAEEPAAGDQAPTSYSVAITAPADDTPIPNRSGNFTVTVSLDPEPEESMSLQLYLNGEAWGEPQQSTVFELVSVYRGTHALTVSLLNKSGKVLTTSAPVSVHVFRPSVN